MMLGATILIAIVLALVAAGWMLTRRRGMHLWLRTYVRKTGTRCDPEPGKPVHLLLCIADHFEPQHGQVSGEKAWERVTRWTSDYPRLFDQFRDSDGRPPRHTFFYPLELYETEHLDALAALCRRGFGEVEVQLHHDNDTADSLRHRLNEYKQLLHSRHGLLSRRDGQIVYGFVHGNWALDNSHPSGWGCGVNNELDILHETGCYADFTFPSAPDRTQPRTINSIYYATDDPARPKSHDHGIHVGDNQRPRRALMLIEGPLVLDWTNRKWGFLPRIENACLQSSQPPSEHRLDLWLRARVQVQSRRDWFFVKLHTHGATESNQAVVLGEPMAQFHRALTRRAEQNPNFHYHYVTAREMYNLVRAAEDGWTGTVEQGRNYELPAPAAQDSQPAVLSAVESSRERNV